MITLLTFLISSSKLQCVMGNCFFGKEGWYYLVGTIKIIGYSNRLLTLFVSIIESAASC